MITKRHKIGRNNIFY